MLASMLVEPEPTVFDVNRPFHYYIKYNSPNVALFEGYIIEPKV